MMSIFRMLCLLAAPPKITYLVGPVQLFYHCIWYQIIGYPYPNLTWYKNGNELTTNKKVPMKNTANPRLEMKITSGCLNFELTHANHNANYTLVAENEYGSDSKTLFAKFSGSPGKWS